MSQLIDDLQQSYLGLDRRVLLSKGIDFLSPVTLAKFFDDQSISVEKLTEDAIHFLKKNCKTNLLTVLLLLEDDPLLYQNSEVCDKINCPFLIIPVFKSKETEPLNGFKLQCKYIYQFLTLPVQRKQFESVIFGAVKQLELIFRNSLLEKELNERSRELAELTEVGKAFAAERNYDKLLRLILEKSKQLTNCEAASIYLVKHKKKESFLRFIISDLDLEEEGEKLSLDKKSIAGYVALTGEILNIEDAYTLSEEADYSFNYSYDKQSGYRTKSMLVLPMRDHESKIIGVLQLINKKTPFNNDAENSEVISFLEHDMEIVSSLAGQAAVAIETSSLEERSREIRELTEIGKALATERNHSYLLRTIMDRSKEIVGADAGSIYLVSADEKTNEKILKFHTSDMLLQKKEVTIPLNKKSIAGYVASTGKILNIEDAYEIDKDSEYNLNLDYDKQHSYRTKSMLVLPMTNQRNDVIGVLQLINKKKHKFVLGSEDSMEKEVVPFDEHDTNLVSSIAGQAAVAIENNILYKNIENLFEGFVKASVTAIESRDPTTSGHSERVALYTVELAKIVDRADDNKWSHIKFSVDQIKEIRYASLLHDFGKVGVREKVLVKPTKLYPEQLELIQSRFQFIKRTYQYEASQRKIQYLLDKSREEALILLDEEDKKLDIDLKEVDSCLEMIFTANKPEILESNVNNTILKIAQLSYQDFTGLKGPFLTGDEVQALSIRRGSLGDLERVEIESHVTHTFEFLSKIPWTNELKNIPEIAHAHHEKLNGDGYPRGIRSKDIPVQSKIMTISDIFDALIANDRPYKKAVQLERALDILKLEVKDNHIDPDLVNMFIEAKVFNAKLDK